MTPGDTTSSDTQATDKTAGGTPLPTDPPKWLQRRINLFDNSGPVHSILVLKEEHGTRFIDPRDFGGYLKACQHIFDGRLKDGYWYDEDPPEHPGPAPEEPPGIGAVDDPEIQKLLRERRFKHKRKLQAFEQDQEFHTHLVAARDRTCPWAAAWIIEHRQDHEYEGFSVEELEMPASDKEEEEDDSSIWYPDGSEEP